MYSKTNAKRVLSTEISNLGKIEIINTTVKQGSYTWYVLGYKFSGNSGRFCTEFWRQIWMLLSKRESFGYNLSIRENNGPGEATRICYFSL